jgi:hypothetical protein
MLSNRARNVLKWNNFNMSDWTVTKRQLIDAIALGHKFRNCGPKTMREFEEWFKLNETGPERVTESLLVAGAISVLTERGYTVNKGESEPHWMNRKPCTTCDRRGTKKCVGSRCVAWNTWNKEGP